jgi:glutaryl-CoA dehydrogenase (non-decarboxylating)
MQLELTETQKKARAGFRRFVDEEIVPYAEQFDREQRTPLELIKKLAHQGYLGAILPQEYSGSNMDAIAYGLLNKEVARGSASLHSFLVVSSMVTRALLRWGSKSQKGYWLPKIALGEIIPAFCISELNAGSDTQNIETTATLFGDSYVLNGHKRWSSYGQIADVFLVFAQCDGSPCAFLVEKNTPGLSIKPISGMVGMRAAMLAQVYLNGCRIPQENLVCKPGSGLSHVAYTALDQARYNVAWGCVGIAQACLETCLEYTSQRQQFGVYLKEHQLIRQMITEMIVKIKAARLLCYQAGYLKQNSTPHSIMETLIAKYFASTMVTKVTSDAVQIHGAYGCSSDSPVQRYWRDAKIMEIVEGSTQLC